MTWNDLALQLVQLIMPVIAALLVALIGYGVAYVRKRAALIDNEIAQQSVMAALSEAEKVARDAINATNQVLVDKLKAQAADGKLTKDEAARAMSEAQQYFMSHLSAGSFKVLQSALGPVEEWLQQFLEAKIGEQKSVQAQVSKLANPPSSPG